MFASTPQPRVAMPRFWQDRAEGLEFRYAKSDQSEGRCPSRSLGYLEKEEAAQPLIGAFRPRILRLASSYVSISRS